MKRRNFAVSTVLAVSAAAAVTAMGAPGDKKAGKQFLEFRRYLLDSAEKQQALEAFFRDVEIPALNRLGIKAVGVFKEMEGESLTIHMLIPHPSLESFSTLSDRLAADKKYMADGDSILNTDKKNAPFLRIESSLMKAFNRMPEVVVPEKVEGRVYELRQYESACFVAGKSKVEMFDSAGEIEIFLETGINPVFFGETLIGSKVPNLTYMISFKDMADHDASWDKFKVHPEWERLRGIEKFKGNVSNITRTFLKAVPYSQI
jgi:hypothetical protein